MKFIVGDKVSFLNEKRDGIIKKIINESLVSVEIEDGFEVPVLAKELIRTGFNKEVAELHSVPFNKEPVHNFKEPIEEEEEGMPQILKEDADFKKTGLFLCFVPDNQENPLASKKMDILFVNKTDYTILFSLYKKADEIFTPVTYDALDQNAALQIDAISFSELNNWNNILTHILYFSENDLPVKVPVAKDVKVPATKLFKDTSFIYSKMLEAKAFILPLVEDLEPEAWDDSEWENMKITPVAVRNIKEMMAQSTIADVNKKHIVAPYIAEVDLHIEQLTDNPEVLSNHEKLNMQIRYFTECLDAAVVHKFKKITFIHGVGSGILKQTIHEIIKESYPGIKIQDAPLKKYGVGATEVLIPFNLVF